MAYSPADAVATLRVNRVVVDTNVTLAPATTALLGSLTVPVPIRAVLDQLSILLGSATRRHYLPRLCPADSVPADLIGAPAGEAQPRRQRTEKRRPARTNKRSCGSPSLAVKPASGRLLPISVQLASARQGAKERSEER